MNESMVVSIAKAAEKHPKKHSQFSYPQGAFLMAKSYFMIGII